MPHRPKPAAARRAERALSQSPIPHSSSFASPSPARSILANRSSSPARSSPVSSRSKDAGVDPLLACFIEGELATSPYVFLSPRHVARTAHGAKAQLQHIVAASSGCPNAHAARVDRELRWRDRTHVYHEFVARTHPELFPPALVAVAERAAVLHEHEWSDQSDAVDPVLAAVARRMLAPLPPPFDHADDGDKAEDESPKAETPLLIVVDGADAQGQHCHMMQVAPYAAKSLRTCAGLLTSAHQLIRARATFVTNSTPSSTCAIKNMCRALFAPGTYTITAATDCAACVLGAPLATAFGIPPSPSASVDQIVHLAGDGVPEWQVSDAAKLLVDNSGVARHHVEALWHVAPGSPVDVDDERKNALAHDTLSLGTFPSLLEPATDCAKVQNLPTIASVAAKVPRLAPLLQYAATGRVKCPVPGGVPWAAVSDSCLVAHANAAARGTYAFGPLLASDVHLALASARAHLAVDPRQVPHATTCHRIDAVFQREWHDTWRYLRTTRPVCSARIVKADNTIKSPPGLGKAASRAAPLLKADSALDVTWATLNDGIRRDQAFAM